MIQRLAGGCLVATLDAGATVQEGGVTLRYPMGTAAGSSGLSLRALEIAAGLHAVPPPPGCDEVLYLIEGSGRVRLGGRDHAVEPDCGFYRAAGQPLAIENPGPSPMRLASAFVPASPSTPPEAPIARLADREAIPTSDRWYRLVVDASCGSREVTQFVGGIPPGRAPAHFHHYEEILVILRGKGRMWSAESSAEISPGSCVWLPAHQMHATENTGPGELRLLGIFWPAGSPAVRYGETPPTT